MPPETPPADGQQVNYAYDFLKRLSTAGTAAAGWGQAYTYDGFGSLTAATVTQGSGVNFAQAYDVGIGPACSLSPLVTRNRSKLFCRAMQMGHAS